MRTGDFIVVFGIVLYIMFLGLMLVGITIPERFQMAVLVSMVLAIADSMLG